MSQTNLQFYSQSNWQFELQALKNSQTRHRKGYCERIVAPVSAVISSFSSEGKAFLLSCSAAWFCCPLRDLRLPTENRLRMRRNSGILGRRKTAKCVISVSFLQPERRLHQPPFFLSLSLFFTHTQRHRVSLSHTFPHPESLSEGEVSDFLR